MMEEILWEKEEHTHVYVQHTHVYARLQACAQQRPLRSFKKEMGLKTTDAALCDIAQVLYHWNIIHCLSLVCHIQYANCVQHTATCQRYPCVSMCLKYHQYCTCCVNLQHNCHGAIPVSVCVLSVINTAHALSTYSTPVIEVSLSVCVLRVISSVHTVNLTHTCHGGILVSMCLKCYQWCIHCHS